MFYNEFHLRRFFFLQIKCIYFIAYMHWFNFTNVFDLTNVFAMINPFILCTNAFATEAYHFKPNALAVFISRAATVPMFS